MARKARTWTPAELARMLTAVESGVFVSVIAIRFATTHDKVLRLCDEHGWKRPVQPAKLKKPPRPKRGASFALANLEQDRRKAGEVMDRKLYGDLLDDVTFLRRVGFGLHKERGGFRLGNNLVSADRIRETAARERRLAGGGA